MMLAATACVLLAAASAPPTAAAPSHAFKLDPKLKEVSGLAPASATSVFAHDDEYAIVHEVDLATGAILRSFAFGKPTIAGDFEAIVKIDNAVWLVLSDGRLYEGQIAAHRKRTRFNTYDTGVGEFCEVEGLAASGDGDRLYLLCKNYRAEKMRDLRIYEWSRTERAATPKTAVDAPLASLVPAGAEKEFRPSELVLDPRTGNFLILNASGGVLEITGTGAFVRYRPLDRAQHPQPEGLALMPNGRLVVADEGGKRAGTLAIYDWRR